MLQELLLALYGFPGAIFIESAEQSGADLESALVPVTDHLPAIAHGELASYAELLKLGSCYNVSEKFIRRYTGPSNSLYMTAIAFGFDEALNKYRQALCALESDYLVDPSLDVSHASYRLHKYKILLPILADLAKKIDRLYQEAHRRQQSLGCRLLDVLLTSAPPGLPGPRSAMRKLLAHAMLVFHRQLTSWLLYGVLHDPHNEFFIEQVVPSHQENHQTNDSYKPGSTPSGVVTNSGQTVSKEEVAFSLAVDRIPSFLPTSFAQHVLFAGEAVNHAIRSASRTGLLKELESMFAERFKGLSDALRDGLATEDCDTVADGKTGGMKSLIDLSPLQQLVSEVRAFVSRQVWHDLVREHGLLAHLRLVKDVALLGRGELFLAFLDHLNQSTGQFEASASFPTVNSNRGLLDRVPPTDGNEMRALEYDVTSAFLAAARSVGLDDDELDARFRFVLSLQPEATDNSSGSTQPTESTLWDRLHLQLVVPPAFSLLFSKQVCRGYDRMFRFLSTIRRTQVALQQFWADQTALWRRVCARGQFGARLAESFPRSQHLMQRQLQQPHQPQSQSIIDRRLLVRNYMAFIVENIQYYLQVDVIESQFCHLLDRIQSDMEADLVLVAHEAYLSSLQAQSLLFHPTARSCIGRLLTVCQRFVQVASQSTDQITELEELLVNDLQHLSASLFHCMSSSRATGTRPAVGLESGLKRFDHSSAAMPTADLDQLLLRLDFNQFYSRSQGMLDVMGLRSGDAQPDEKTTNQR